MALPAALLALLLTAIPSLALSSHSPQDLFAFPRYSVVLKQDGVLNDTVPSLLEAHASSKPDEDEAHPAAVHLLRTPAGQAFLCTVPAVKQDVAQAERHEADALERSAARERGLERGLALLEPMRGGCLFQRQNWFTYSFCYGQEIRQFHETRSVGSPTPSEDPNADSYTLGQAPEPVSTEPPKYGSGSGALARRGEKVPSTLGGGGEGGGVLGLGAGEGGAYLSQVWEDGTVCDKTGVPRSVEVQFHCNTQTIDRIALIRETAICRYVLIIHTPRLCSEAVFLEGRRDDGEPSNMIECQPVVKEVKQAQAVDAPSPPSPIPSDPPATAAAPPLSQALEDGDVLTLVYDPSTGAMLSAQNEAGEEVLSGEELGAALGGEAEHESEGAEERKVKELGELAKLMRETIAEALRDVAFEGAAASTDREKKDQDEPVVINGVQIQGLADMVAALARGGAQSQGSLGSTSGAGASEGRKQRTRVQETVRGSEEHEKLKEGWRAIYDQEEEQLEGRSGGRTRDEL